MIPFFGSNSDKLLPGIRFLDYLNLSESRLGVLWASLDVEYHWKKIMKCNKIMCRYGLDTSCNIYKGIYVRPKYMRTIEFYVYLATSDLRKLLSKKSELEMCLRTGHLFNELCRYVVQAEDKSKAVNLIIRIIDRAQYCKLFGDYILNKYLEKILRMLEALYLSNKLPNYAKNVVDIVKLFCARESMVYYLYSASEISFSFLIKCARKEHFNLFELWEQNGLYTYQLTDISFLENRKVAEILLLNGGLNYYYDTSYQLIVMRAANYIGFKFHEDSDIRFLEHLEIIKKDKMIIYRCCQVYILYMSHSEYSSTSKSLLQLIWKNISDPFLTYDDFNELIVETPNNNLKHQMLQVWSWYSSIFNLGEGYIKTPRILQHLTGSVIRKQLLKNFNYPDGVKWLYLPQGSEDHIYISRLKKYLKELCIV